MNNFYITKKNYRDGFLLEIFTCKMQVKRRVDEWSLLCFHMQMSGWMFFHSNFETVINFDDVFRCRPCAKRSVETPHQKLHSSLCILCWSAESNKSSRLFFWFFFAFVATAVAVAFYQIWKVSFSGPMIKMNAKLQLNVGIVTSWWH